MSMKHSLFVATLAALLPQPAMPQTGQTTPKNSPPPPPATKLEAFQPEAGSVVTVGYDDLGKFGIVGGVSVDVREVRSGSTVVRGLVVRVIEDQYRDEVAFVDAEEIPDLIKGINALLAIRSNPTPFTRFEVRYTTRGEFMLVAFNTITNETQFVMQAGRVTIARKVTREGDMRKLKAMLEAAQAKLASLSG